MRIENSTVQMGSSRTYQADATMAQTTIRRNYGNGVQRAIGHTSMLKSSQFEVSGGTSVFHSSSSDMGLVQQENDRYVDHSTRPTKKGVPARVRNQLQNAVQDAVEGSVQNADTEQQQVEEALAQSVNANNEDWLSQISDSIEKDPKIQMLRKCLEMLERLTTRNSLWGFRSSPNRYSSSRGVSTSFQMSSSTVASRYQQSMALFGGEDLTLPIASNRGGINGYWTNQTVSAGISTSRERTTFSSMGTVVTSDGRTIDFGVNVEMSRSFTQAFQVASQEAVYTDPLVINLDTDAASLSDVTFRFDLDGDGKEEEVSQLNSSSGFLALDKNGDGKINDGSELFGAKSGNGFSELAQYDQDGNGWIDENDAVFSQLSVWVQCGNGESKLLSLKEADVGAIFLGSQSTDYTLEDSSGEEKAKIRRSGVYLKESSGQVGTVQHVDFKT